LKSTVAILYYPHDPTHAKEDRMNILEGLRVVDLTSVIAGSFGSMLLGDLGADVVKIEPPQGEHYRYAMDGAILIAMNRNKRGIALDLRTPEGQEIALRLASQADVFIENLKPGTTTKLGLAYEHVAAVNPRIVYCSVSGFGQSGPDSERPAYDPLVQARSGIMMATGEPGGKPVRQATSLVDMTASLYATSAILACLLQREKTGKGQRIDVSLMDSAVSAMNYYLTYHSFTGKLTQRVGSGHATWAVFQAFEAKDRLIWIGAGTDKFWAAFCQALGLDDLAKDKRYATGAARREHRKELLDRVSQICRRYTSAELEEKLVRAGVPCSRLLTIDEVPDDPQIQHRGLIEEWDYTDKGRIQVVRTPTMIDGHLPDTRLQAPRLGEHTVQVLKELGYAQDHIRQLLDAKTAVQCTT
jgi:crotonobetainyl-CoA:carnitine CoA-transferase CaiB-like acyl-CoA transferase